MVLGKVVGTLVSTQKEELIENTKLLLIEKISAKTHAGKGDFAIAVDSVGAGLDDTVLLVSGSSARMTAATDGKPCDLTIVGIVDQIEMSGKLVYNKAKEGDGV